MPTPIPKLPPIPIPSGQVGVVDIVDGQVRQRPSGILGKALLGATR